MNDPRQLFINFCATLVVLAGVSLGLILAEIAADYSPWAMRACLLATVGIGARVLIEVWFPE